MNNFSFMQSMSLDELAMWLYKNCNIDDAPWTKWFTDTCCNRCEPVIISPDEAESKLGIKSWSNLVDVECAYCELEHKCKYYLDFDDIPDNLEIIKMWLKQEQ